MKVIGIIILGIIWYLIIGAFVTVIICKMDGISPEEASNEGRPVIASVLVWPLVAIVLIFMGLGKLIKIISTGAYNLINKPKKKEATTIYDDYDDCKPKYEYKNTTITTTSPAWYYDENDEVKKMCYKEMGGNAEIMKMIEEAIDECEKKYGVKIKEVTDIFGGEYEKTYMDFMADNGKTYCLEIPVSIKDLRRWTVLRGYTGFKEEE